MYDVRRMVVVLQPFSEYFEKLRLIDELAVVFCFSHFL